MTAALLHAAVIFIMVGDSIFCGRSKLRLDLGQTVGADTLAAEEGDVVRVVAEYAGGVIFLQNDTVVIGEDLNSVLDLNVHRFANLNGENDSAQLVYFSYHSGGFHNMQVPFICYQ